MPPTVDAPPPAPGPGGHHRVVIVGAGFGGIALALRLRNEGVDDLVVLERESDLGGTWFVNTYPGCQCDVPSLLYSLSTDPSAEWSRTFALQEEIEEYLRTVADRHDLKRLIRFDTTMTGADWDPDAHRWAITTSATGTGTPTTTSSSTSGHLTADVLIVATGPLSEPSLPDIPGLDTFEGALFHSARWDHDHDLSGERVAVVGTGASAVQFVPEIQPEVAHLTVFQRTAPWVVPRPDRPFTDRERRRYRRSTRAARLARARIYWSRELLVLMFAKYPGLSTLAARPALRHLADQVPDPALRARLTPDYALGCKRVLPSNEYLPALGQPNVEVVTDRIARVGPHGVTTEDGTEHPVDTIILGTGFAATDPPVAGLIRAADGRTMRQHWNGSAAAYLGTAVAGFPNLFLVIGPNTGLGHSSMVFMIESQANYVADALKTMAARNLAAVEVTPGAVGRYNEGVQAGLARSVWNSGCRSWYLDARGRNTTIWPDFTWRFRQRTRRFDPEAYVLTRRT
jgi:cation diffusion facilitator CzcD-associated flavoprotein CzcO